MTPPPDTPILLTDDSPESTDAFALLFHSNVRFETIPSEGPGPILVSSTGTYPGLDEIGRFVARHTRAA
jgi:hypothetical protein